MSEYQYYEFVSVDKPLTSQEQAQLRARSTRATITTSSFINEYRWGDLKGDPLDWMRQYFDAHVYSSNFGSCNFMLRIPRDAIDDAIFAKFTARADSLKSAYSPYGFRANTTPEYRILQWRFHDDSGDVECFWGRDDGPGWMSRLLPLRDELLRGDTRPLYLGWLASACNEHLTDEDTEPLLPTGLQTLSLAQEALVEFLMIDPDWLEAAAEASAESATLTESEADVDSWLDTQTSADMRAVLRQLIDGRSREIERGVRGRFVAWQRTKQQPNQPPVTQRTVAQIAARCEAAASIRLAREKKATEALETTQRAERIDRLNRLAAKADDAWTAIDKSLQRGSGLAYDQALTDIIELAQALKQANRDTEFRHELKRLMVKHGKRAAWVTRLEKAGIL